MSKRLFAGAAALLVAGFVAASCSSGPQAIPTPGTLKYHPVGNVTPEKIPAVVINTYAGAPTPNGGYVVSYVANHTKENLLESDLMIYPASTMNGGTAKGVKLQIGTGQDAIQILNMAVDKKNDIFYLASTTASVGAAPTWSVRELSPNAAGDYGAPTTVIPDIAQGVVGLHVLAVSSSDDIFFSQMNGDTNTVVEYTPTPSPNGPSYGTPTTVISVKQSPPKGAMNSAGGIALDTMDSLYLLTNSGPSNALSIYRVNLRDTAAKPAVAKIPNLTQPLLGVSGGNVFVASAGSAGTPPKSVRQITFPSSASPTSRSFSVQQVPDTITSGLTAKGAIVYPAQGCSVATSSTLLCVQQRIVSNNHVSYGNLAAVR